MTPLSKIDPFPVPGFSDWVVPPRLYSRSGCDVDLLPVLVTLLVRGSGSVLWILTANGSCVVLWKGEEGPSVRLFATHFNYHLM